MNINEEPVTVGMAIQIPAGNWWKPARVVEIIEAIQVVRVMPMEGKQTLLPFKASACRSGAWVVAEHQRILDKAQAERDAKRAAEKAAALKAKADEILKGVKS
jgi:hypothetical protein